MLVVNDIEIIETHDKKHYYETYKYDSSVIGVYDNPEKNAFAEVTIETIAGKRFRNTKGLDVVIGWSEQVQTALGLPFEVFESAERRRRDDYEENERLRKRLRKYKEMSILKFVVAKIRRSMV